MKIKAVEMPRAEARRAFLDYRHAVRERHDAEDAQLMRCYRALSQGQQVINLNDAMRRAGEDKNGLPRLAISRADYEQVDMHRQWEDGRVEMGPAELFPSWGRRSNASYTGRLFRFDRVFSIREGTLRNNRNLTADRFSAIVPNIPPAFRPAFDLCNYQLLWEARWEIRQQPLRSPRDPALLKHLGGPLYAVLAMWDLTPVEQAVLGVTRN